MMLAPRHLFMIALCAVSFALGWYVRSPAPPSYQPVTNALVASAKQDTVVVEKVVTNTKWKIRYDSIRDTLNITDTVQVREYVRVADSSLFACNQALNSCLTALKLKDTAIKEQTRYIEVQSRRPSLMRDLVLTALTGTAGYMLGKAAR